MPRRCSRWAASRARDLAELSAPSSRPRSTSIRLAAGSAPPGRQIDSASCRATRRRRGSPPTRRPARGRRRAGRGPGRSVRPPPTRLRQRGRSGAVALRTRATQPSAVSATAASDGGASSSASSAATVASLGEVSASSLASPASAGTSTCSSLEARARLAASSYAALPCSLVAERAVDVAEPAQPAAVRFGPRRRLMLTARSRCQRASSYSPTRVSASPRLCRAAIRAPVGRATSVARTASRATRTASV